MVVSLVIGTDGSVAFAVGQGDFEQASAALQQIARELQMRGVNFESMGDIEKHRHDHEHEPAHTTVGQT